MPDLSRSQTAGAVLAIAVAVLAGCGSSGALPPAAEPPVSPPVQHPPAGRVVRVGSQPEGVVVDPASGLVAVALRNPDRLALVDGRTGRVARRVRLPESARHLALAPPGGPVLVPAERANVLAEVGPRDGAPVSIRVGSFPHDAVAAGGRIFVGNEMGGTVSVIERRKVIRVLKAPAQPGGVASSGLGQVVVVGVRAREIEAFDAGTLRSLGTLSAGAGPTHVVSGARKRFYVADTSGDTILEYAVDPKLRLVDRVNTPAPPYGLALDPRRRQLWVTLPSRNRVLRYNLPKAGGAVRETGSFPTVRQPNTVAVDSASGRVFVASRASNTLQLFDPPKGP